MADDNDPYGPTGATTRSWRQNSGQISWPLRSDARPETADNARSEFARAQAERGKGRDITLPKTAVRSDSTLRAGAGVNARGQVSSKSSSDK